MPHKLGWYSLYFLCTVQPLHVLTLVSHSGLEYVPVHNVVQDSKDIWPQPWLFHLFQAPSAPQPISVPRTPWLEEQLSSSCSQQQSSFSTLERSEERRVGKECRSR